VDVPLWLWFAVLGVIVSMLAVDLFAHRRAHVIGVREGAIWSAVWVAFGVAFGAWIWAEYGAEFGQQYFAGYLIEKSLAVDNVFVWAIIFTYFAVPQARRSSPASAGSSTCSPRSCCGRVTG
jgi:predicted tellurium resistance membrane protein TerC